MIKKKKKLLFAFIVLIIAVLLFSVIGVITVYLAGPQQEQRAGYDNPAYQEAIVENLNLTGGTVTITTGSGDVLTGAVE